MRVLIQRTLAAGFDWHNYGKSTIGARTDVERVDIGRLQAFYRLYYQPDNAVLVIAGAFDPDNALALVAKYFGADPAARRASCPSCTPTSRCRTATGDVTLRRVGNTQWLSAMYHTVPGAHPDAVATRSRRRHHDAHARRAPVQVRWSKARKPPPSTTSSTPATIPDLRCFSRRCRKRTRSLRRATTMLQTIEGVETAAVHAVELDRVRAKTLK